MSLASTAHLRPNTAHALNSMQTSDKIDNARTALHANQTVDIAETLLKMKIHHCATDRYHTKEKFVVRAINKDIESLKERATADFEYD